jgi:hypothetical protein
VPPGVNPAPGTPVERTSPTGASTTPAAATALDPAPAAGAAAGLSPDPGVLTIPRLARLRLRDGVLTVAASCSRECGLVATARLGVRGGPGVVDLSPAERRGLRLGRQTVVRPPGLLFATGAARTGALRGLRAGRAVVARVVVVATFPDGVRRTIVRFARVVR